MSTSVLYPNAAAEWKQEASQRLAAHRRRRSMLAAQPAEPALHWEHSSGRGSMVAARVAARYAHAPSFNQLPAAKAPVAPHAAQPVAAPAPRIAPKPLAAQPAPKPAETPRPSAPVLQTAPSFVRSYVPEFQPPVLAAPLPEPVAPVQASAPLAPPESLDAWESEYAPIAWHPDPRLSPVLSDVVRSPRPAMMDEFSLAQPPVVVEPDLPIHANLIEFPREVVAARKMRPRRAERQMQDELDRQLSIFEVDPGAYPAPATVAEEPLPAEALPKPEWSGIKLQPQAQPVAKLQEPSVAEADVHLAPVGHRLMAVLVDGALVTAVFVVLSMVGAAGARTLPGPKVVALGTVSILILLGLIYQALFLLLAEATPGMRYAGISLCTFDGQIPTPADLRSRLGGMLFSVVPAGLGLAWALLDEDRLCWHDRLSRTYLRKE
ncbi:MAG: RDD family protein [Terracidiphilus sp.]